MSIGSRAEASALHVASLPISVELVLLTQTQHDASHDHTAAIAVSESQWQWNGLPQLAQSHLVKPSDTAFLTCSRLCSRWQRTQCAPAHSTQSHHKVSYKSQDGDASGLLQAQPNRRCTTVK